MLVIFTILSGIHSSYCTAFKNYQMWFHHLLKVLQSKLLVTLTTLYWA